VWTTTDYTGLQVKRNEKKGRQIRTSQNIWTINYMNTTVDSRYSPHFLPLSSLSLSLTFFPPLLPVDWVGKLRYPKKKKKIPFVLAHILRTGENLVGLRVWMLHIKDLTTIEVQQ
jgi:hypothetical protein